MRPSQTTRDPSPELQRLVQAEIRRELAGGALVGESRPLEVRETHASLVFLAPSDVYKLKKPLDLGFLNYSTLRRRGRMCRTEVLLNRRLAPDVYLGVDLVTQNTAGLLQLNGRGRVVDYLVHMRRLRDENALDARLRTDACTIDELRGIGERIGRFHRATPVGPVACGPRTFLRNAQENLTAVGSAAAPFPQSVLAELESYFAEAARATQGLLDERAAAGRVRDGHGDLRAEHVYLENGIAIIDCVEFSPRYRASDTALDVAFLVMDLVAQGFPDAVGPLVESYERAAGDAIGSVLRLYSWYRALVRTRVATILERQENLSDGARLAAALSARRHLYHALRFARDDTSPLLILVGGLPGTGKSTVSRALGSAIGAPVISADEVRKRLAGLGSGVHLHSGTDEGLYADAMNRRVYASLMATADAALTRGRSLILDATFRRSEDRERARTLALRHHARVVVVECSAPEDVVRRRLRQRAVVPDAWSDATEATFDAHLASYAHPAGDVRIVQTVRPTLAEVERVLWSL